MARSLAVARYPSVFAVSFVRTFFFPLCALGAVVVKNVLSAQSYEGVFVSGLETL